MMSLWDALRMNMMISYQELVRTFLNVIQQTDLIGFVPTCILEYISFQNKFKIIEAPFKIPAINIYMIYNRVNIDDPKFAKFIDDFERNNAIE